MRRAEGSEESEGPPGRSGYGKATRRIGAERRMRFDGRGGETGKKGERVLEMARGGDVPCFGDGAGVWSLVWGYICCRCIYAL